MMRTEGKVYLVGGSVIGGLALILFSWTAFLWVSIGVGVIVFIDLGWHLRRIVHNHRLAVRREPVQPLRKTDDAGRWAA